MTAAGDVHKFFFIVLERKLDLMFQVNPLLLGRGFTSKNQVLFSLKDKSKKLKCHLLQFLFGALRVKTQLLNGGRTLFNCKGGTTAHSLSLSPAHCPDMTEILLKRMLNCKSSIHLSLGNFLYSFVFTKLMMMLN